MLTAWPDAGGGTRTPDTRIMIPARFGSTIGNSRLVGHAVGHKRTPAIRRSACPRGVAARLGLVDQQGDRVVALTRACRAPAEDDRWRRIDRCARRRCGAEHFVAGRRRRGACRGRERPIDSMMGEGRVRCRSEKRDSSQRRGRRGAWRETRPPARSDYDRECGARAACRERAPGGSCRDRRRGIRGHRHRDQAAQATRTW